MKIIIFPWAKILRNEQKHPKNYPWWPQLIKLLQQDGHHITQVGLSGEPQLVEDFRTDLPIKELEKMILEYDAWFSVDSFGQHLAWSLGKKGIAIFGQSDPNVFGHHENINVLKDRSYLRDRQFWWWEQAEYREDCWVEPEKIYEIFVENFIKDNANA
jgi:ADP-heptose:LPS heptosyltransferase